jgi:septal ring factor EnvC (AmiA/AmiB activator)
LTTRPLIPPILRALLLAGLCLGAPWAGLAQEGEPAPASQAPPAPTAAEAEAAAERARRQGELKAIEQALAANAEARRRLDAEIGELKGDRTKLAASLLNTADHLRATEDRIAALEGRLAALTSSEGAIRRSLDARRGVIVEVLAVLQRMGRRPPPAVLARPEDMLEAIRASMLLGAVLPELRGEVEDPRGRPVRARAA